MVKEFQTLVHDQPVMWDVFYDGAYEGMVRAYSLTYAVHKARSLMPEDGKYELLKVVMSSRRGE